MRKLALAAITLALAAPLAAQAQSGSATGTVLSINVAVDKPAVIANFKNGAGYTPVYIETPGRDPVATRAAIDLLSYAHEHGLQVYVNWHVGAAPDRHAILDNVGTAGWTGK